MMRQQHTEEQHKATASTLIPVQHRTFDEWQESTLESEVDVTANLIADLSGAVRKRKRALAWLPLPTIILTAALIAARLLLFNSVSGIKPVYEALLAIFIAGNTGMIALLFTGVMRLDRAAKALSGTNDIRTVGVLVESLSAGEPGLSIAGSLLIRLLPQMTREDALKLTTEQREYLRNGLRNSASRLKHTHYNPTLAIAILRAIERFGDETDIAAVKSQASRRAVTPDQRSIREAAEKCLATLTVRLIGESGPSVVWMEAKLAETANPSLSTEAAGALAARLRRIARLRRRNLGVTAIGSVVGTVLAFISMHGFSAGLPQNPMLAGGMLSSLAIMVGFALSGTYTQRNLTNALIHSDDLLIVPPLIQAAATVEISSMSAVMLLIRLLPRLRASDAKLLNADDRTLLHTAMAKHSSNSEFIRAALHALQQVGDAASIPIVQRFAERSGRRTTDPRVCDAAHECLEFLKQRDALSNANQTLLRASSAAATPTDSLLRPIDNASHTISGELLRTTTAPVVYVKTENSDAQQNIQSFVLQPSS